jgi:hypothetical protein
LQSVQNILFELSEVHFTINLTQNVHNRGSIKLKKNETC